MSFLETQLKRRASLTATVPDELLEEWTDGSGTLPAAFLLHPRIRRQGTEQDVREVLEKKQLALPQRVSSTDFVKLAARVHKKSQGSSSSLTEAMITLDVSDGGPSASAGLDALNELLATPKWAARDESPAQVAPDLFIGSAEHAADLPQLKQLGITAVLNAAPSVCDDPTDLYEDNGMAYAECDAEDFDGYPVLECHLPDVTSFVEAQRSGGGRTLIHCFAGVNRSAALAIALLTLREKRPLLAVAAECFEKRPFILSNESFRKQLVALAAKHGLLHATVPGVKVVAG